MSLFENATFKHVLKALLVDLFYVSQLGGIRRFI